MRRSTTRGLVLLLVLQVAVAAFGALTAVAATNTTFQFSRSSNLSSTLTLFRRDTATGQVYNSATWRAGSGDSTNECIVGHGWLPAGSYDIRLHSDYYGGSKIQGRVWYLSDKRCSGGSGNLRTELFIHSEETSSQGQSCGAGDLPFCWEGSHDYYSAGCIKLNHYGDLPSADTDWHGWGGTTGANKLYVA
ncbi:MAG: hypothetical protein QOH73_2674 [Gaiellaceae bacterium]|jgi:hypothetical protein|nr:hypothetical protein [Gaiellaceae bacterium]